MLEALPQIWSFFVFMIQGLWSAWTTCSVLAGFLALAVLDRMFGLFDVLKR